MRMLSLVAFSFLGLADDDVSTCHLLGSILRGSNKAESGEQESSVPGTKNLDGD